MWLNRLKMWAVRLKLQRDEQIRALTAAVTATAQTVNDRDAHIRALTAKLQERDSKIAELAKQNRLLTAAMTGRGQVRTASNRRTEAAYRPRRAPGVGAPIVEFGSGRSGCAYRADDFIAQLDHNATAEEHDMRQLSERRN